MYRVKEGDTLDIISRRSYGTGDYGSLIRRANPGIKEPLIVDSLIIIPTLPGSPKNLSFNVPQSRNNEPSLIIDGRRFRFWSDISITRSIDQIDTLEFSCPFDHNKPRFKETFRPFSYKPIELYVDSQELFLGTIMGINPIVEKTSKTLSVSAYSLPGVLNDCTPPASLFAEGENSLEFNNFNLREIAIELASPFGISTTFLDDPGAAFDRVAIKPQEKILGFLTDLAKQRNMIISSGVLGDLLFQRSITNEIEVAQLRQGFSPVLSVRPFFSPQEYYSHITGIQPIAVGSRGSQYTVKNPHLPGVTRPLTFETPDVLEGDTPTAANAKMGRMYGNSCAYTVSLSTWRDSFGELWEPNTIVTLFAPEAMVYTEYQFLIRSVSFKRDRESETAVLNLIFPDSFSGGIPRSLPWD